MSASTSSLAARLAARLTRDKADTLLLLAAAVMVLAPHAAHLPLWTSIGCAVTLAWRSAVTLRGLRMPPPMLLLPAALAAMGAVFATFHTLLGRDAGVAMLVLLLAFKMLEMHARRDLFVVIFLGFFLVLTNFFYSQSMATALLMVASVILLLTAQLTFQYSGAVPPLARRLRLAASIVGLAAPLALLLFIGFPRIQGPLWGLPGDANAGRSGLSDSMAPGNLSSLAQSDEVAFRVKFLDPAPAQEELYWRGVVLGNFDGRTWTRVLHRPHEASVPLSMHVRGKPVRQLVTLEPSQHRWLFGLELPQRLPDLDGNRATLTPELEMQADFPLGERTRYSLSSYTDFSIQAEAAVAGQPQWLMLPGGLNPRTRALAHVMRSQGDPVKRVNGVLAMFHKQNFVYTLEPPLLGKDGIDEFLFDTRAGFCEHYAGAFVYLMRSMGIPARVVTGYQGGEFNPVDGYLAVRQSDAHAWSEVWLAGQGWVRIDPTAAVAPERVRKSLARAIPRRPPFGIDSLAPLFGFELGKDSWLSQLRFQFSALNNAWNQYVLNYTPERQDNFLQALQAGLFNARSLGGLLLVAALLWLAYRLRARRRLDPADALYQALCAHLARRGCERARDESPRRYALRVAALPLADDKKSAALQLLALYSDYKYGAAPVGAAFIPTLRRLLAQSR